MSDLYYTSEDVSNAISNAEQLALSISTIIDLEPSWELLGASIAPLLLKLHSDIELVSTMHTCSILGLKAHISK